MAANRGTGKLLLITGGVIFLIALALIIFFVLRKGSCPAEVNFEILPGTEITANELITITDKTVKAKKWEWDFGDNSRKEVYTVNKAITHKYSKDGTYIITLKVNGCISSSQTVTVKSEEVIVPPTPDLAPVILGPTGAVYAGQRAKFVDATPGATSWEWFFENGKDIFTEKEVSYIFITPGDKTVQLLVNGGKSQTASFKLKVLPARPAKPADPGAGPVSKGPKSPKITEAAFKQMLIDFIKGKVQPKDFMPYMNNNITMKIQVNDDKQQFDGFLKDLILESNPQIDKVLLINDPETGDVTDIIIKKK